MTRALGPDRRALRLAAADVELALNNNFAFGGINTALVLARR
jgi:3-oxoacyl-(acyl-carrier-protein) synthase